jgi:hypothetical protein
MRERRLVETRRAWREEATRASDRIAIGSALIGGLVVLGVLLVWALWSSTQPLSVPNLVGPAANQAAPRTASGAVPAAQPEQAARPAVALQHPPTPTQAADGRRQVTGTDGEGVVLRASPNDADWTPRGFMDGELVTVLDTSGADWTLVEGNNGEQGWIPTRYLTP